MGFWPIKQTDLVHDLSPQTAYMLHGKGNQYCDAWAFVVVDQSLLVCPAWHFPGQPVRFSESEGDAVQYEVVDLREFPPSLSIDAALDKMEQWYQEYMNLSQDCSCPSYHVFESNDPPDAFMSITDSQSLLERLGPELSGAKQEPPGFYNMERSSY